MDTYLGRYLHVGSCMVRYMPKYLLQQTKSKVYLLYHGTPVPVATIWGCHFTGYTDP